MTEGLKLHQVYGKPLSRYATAPLYGSHSTAVSNIKNREISPHQSLRDSFSSRRSRLAEHRLHFRGGGFGVFAEDGGVKVSSSLWKTPQSLRDSSPTGAPVYRRQQYQTVRLRLVGRCALTPPLVTANRKISPHQSLRDSFSSRRSRLAAHRLHFRRASPRKKSRRVRVGSGCYLKRTQTFITWSVNSNADFCDLVRI